MSSDTKAIDRPRSRVRWAFYNVGNYAYVAGVALVSAIQWADGGWLILAAGAAGEALWVSVGPYVGPARRMFERSRERAEKEAEAERQRALVRSLTEDDRRRYNELELVRREIQRQVESNPSLTMELVKIELGKLDKLLLTFLTLASSAGRYEAFVVTSDLDELETEVRRQQALLEKVSASDKESRALAQKNLEVLQRRVEKATEIRRQLRIGRAQLNLIENTFRLLRDQIVTMHSPEELSGELQELTESVEAIAATGRETEALVRSIDAEIASLER